MSDDMEFAVEVPGTDAETWRQYARGSSVEATTNDFIEACSVYGRDNVRLIRVLDPSVLDAFRQEDLLTAGAKKKLLDGISTMEPDEAYALGYVVSAMEHFQRRAQDLEVRLLYPPMTIGSQSVGQKT